MAVSFSFSNLPHKSEVEELLSLRYRISSSPNLEYCDACMLSTIFDVAAAAAALKLVVSAPSQSSYVKEKTLILSRLREGGEMDVLVAMIVAESIPYFSALEVEFCSDFIQAFVTEDDFSESGVTSSLKAVFSYDGSKRPAKYFVFQMLFPVSFEWEGFTRNKSIK